MDNPDFTKDCPTCNAHAYKRYRYMIVSEDNQTTKVSTFLCYTCGYHGTENFDILSSHFMKQLSLNSDGR